MKTTGEDAQSTEQSNGRAMTGHDGSPKIVALLENQIQDLKAQLEKAESQLEIATTEKTKLLDLLSAEKEESNMPMHAYVVLLHLVSQGYTKFVEMRKVLCRESQGTYYISILAYIVNGIDRLSDGSTITPKSAIDSAHVSSSCKPTSTASPTILTVSQCSCFLCFSF